MFCSNYVINTYNLIKTFRENQSQFESNIVNINKITKLNTLTEHYIAEIPTDGTQSHLV